MVDHHPPCELDEFVTLAAASGLLAEERLQAALERFHRVRPGRADGQELVRAFAAHLVVHGYVTPWQGEELLAGRREGFLVDHYRLYDCLGDDGACRRYRAEDLTSEEHVVLRIRPSDGKQIEYTVED